MKQISIFEEAERAMACQAKFSARELLTFYIAAATCGYCTDGSFTPAAMRFWEYLQPMMNEQEKEISELTDKLIKAVTGKKELRLRNCSRQIMLTLCEYFITANIPDNAKWQEKSKFLLATKIKEKGKIEFDLWTYIQGGRNIPELSRILLQWPRMEKALNKAELAFKRAEAARKKAVEALESFDALTPAERHDAKSVILSGL